VPSFREGKITRVTLAGRQGLTERLRRSTFYSDSTNDLPLLERVSHPVATNPGPALEADRAQRGWPILKLFHDQEVHQPLLGKAGQGGRGPRRRRRRHSAGRQRVEVPAKASTASTPSCSTTTPCAWCARCKDAGHEAYIVGGAVRDLLVGLRPKDFDVATNATPEQVKALFRRAFIIGRRFRIVHVVYGRGREHEVIEVSTFRAYLDASGRAGRGNEKTSKAEMADKSPCGGRQRPRAARQRLGPADRGRRAARLHRQRDVLRPRHADGGRLPRRPADVRRSCCA
jgi:hypothetical protein